MSKFLVQGRDAGSVLNYISAGNVDDLEGRITYTQWLNEDGKMEADVTVSKLASDQFLVVATDTMHRHVEAWLRRHSPSGAHIFVTDVTSGYAQLNIQGPNSREILQKATSENLSNTNFPFRTVREIDIGYARAFCNRITYLGELGYELFIPSEQSVHVYDHLISIGGDDLMHAGLKALGSLRMEKGYRDFGHDMDNTDSVLEVGLGFAVDFNKPGGFLGRDAVMAQKSKGTLHKRLVQVLVNDPDPLMYHGEIILRNGIPVADVRAASYGHTLGGAVGLAMIERQDGDAVNAAFLKSGKWEVDIAGRVYPATLSLRPLYDPSNIRIKA